MEEYAAQKIAALQSSQNFEKFSLLKETPTVATDHTVIEKPDFEGHTQGPWRTSGTYAMVETDKLKICEVHVNEDVSEDDFNYEQWRANAKLIAAAPDLLKENQSLKDRVKEWEDSLPHRALVTQNRTLEAKLKSLEAENEELRKVIKGLIQM